MIPDHRADALVRLAKLYGVEPDRPGGSGTRVGLRFIALTKHIIDVGSDDPESSPLFSWYELVEYDSLHEPIEVEEEFYDHDDGGGRLIDLDQWSITQRSARGWDAIALPT